VSLVQERPKLNLPHKPFPIYRKTKLPCRATTLQPTPRMVMRRCSNTSTPGNRYSRVRRNEKPLGRCALNRPLPSDKADLRMTRLLVVERIRIVSNVDQTCVVWSRRWIRVAIVIRFFFFIIDRILNNILRSSSVFWLLTVDNCSSLSSHSQNYAISL